MLGEDCSLTIGEVVAPFGRLGEMKVRLETDFPERYGRLRQVCLARPGEPPRIVDVQSARLHKGHVLLKVRGVDSIDAVDALRGCLVRIRPEDAVRLPDNEFFIHDLLGCEVVTVDGRVLGALTQVLRGPANDVYVVGSGKGELLLPAIRDVVRQVDLTARRIVVSPTPGLIADPETVAP